jgi:DUF2993 family protein
VRRLLVVLTILALLLVGADFGLKALGQYWVARELRGKLGLAENPAVSLEGFPFIPHLISGRFNLVRIRSGPNSVKGISVEAVRLDLRDVRFSPRQLVVGTDATIRGEQGDGRLTVTGEGVTQALQRARLPLRVRFDNGSVVIGSSSLGLEGRARLSTSGGRLLLTPVGFPRFFSIALPELVRGIQYTAVDVRERDAALSFRVDHPTFALST